MATVTIDNSNFESDVLQAKEPVVVDFWAEWCGPCKMISPALDEIANELGGKVKIAKVNVDENPGLSQTFQIMSIPNLMMIKNRTMVFNQPGALPEPVMRDLIKQLIALEVPAHDENETDEQPAS